MKADADWADQEGVADTGRNSGSTTTCAEADVATRTRTKAEVATTSLMEAAMDRGNLLLAYPRVVANAGAAGVDQLAVSELKDHLKRHWPRIRARLLAGDFNRSRYAGSTYRSRKAGYARWAFRRWRIGSFSRRCIKCCNGCSSRPSRRRATAFGRGATRIRRYPKRASTWRRQALAGGLEKFFDRVNHDLLMSKLAAKIGDARVLTLIRRYLEAGMMADGLVKPRTEGTPQGGPLSPLLSNILLTELDRELERRGHAFYRYADDRNIYVASERAGAGCCKVRPSSWPSGSSSK